MRTEAVQTPRFSGARPLETCPCCGGRERRPYLRSVDFHYAIPGEFDAAQCTRCDLVYVDPMPTPADLGALYPDDYYSFRPPQLEPAWRYLIKRYCGLQKYTYLPAELKTGRMLDVGCGAGQYLLEMRARGWEVYGSELSKGAAAAGRAAGLDIRGGELPEAGFPAAHFDFIRLNHSFEHMPNPDAVLVEIRRLLKPDGRLFIGVPNIDSTWARLFGRYWWYMGLPVHTYNYNPRNLRLLLERHGFTVTETRYNSDFGGSLGSLQIYVNRHRTPRSSDGWLVRSLLLRPPLMLVSKIQDLLRLGDCIEVIAAPSPQGGRVG